MTITTYGNREGLIKNVLMGSGATQKDPNGRFYIDGQMVNVELSRAFVEAIYLSELFQPGFNCTAKYTADTTPYGTLRIPLDTIFQPSSRTLSFGGRKGTPGNDGLFDKHGPVLPVTDEFLLYLNQVNTQDIVFPELSKEYMPLDLMTQKITGYGQSVGQDRSASTLAEIIGYCLYRAMNDGDNLISGFDGSKDNAYADLITQLNSKFTNGDPITGANTFPIDGRVIVARSSFYGIFNKQSGVILNGSNLAQEMLREFDLSKNMSERLFVSEYYVGEFGRIHFLIIPDQMWTFAERYLGLEDGALAGIQAVSYSSNSLAVGKVVDLGVKLQDSAPPYPRGIMARPVNIWGHEMFRKGFVIGDSTFTLDYLKNTLKMDENTRLYPCAPEDIANAKKGHTVTVPIYGSDGSIIGYRQIAEGQYPSGDNWRSGMPSASEVIPSVKGGNYTGAQSVELKSDTEGADIYYTADGSMPTAESAKYSEAVSVEKTSTIKAIAVKNGYVPSAVMSETYTISSAKK